MVSNCLPPTSYYSVAAVYMAVDSKSGSNVVIKVYHKAKMQTKHHHKLAREIEAMERMNGAYCAELYGTFSNEDSVCLVMVSASIYRHHLMRFYYMFKLHFKSIIK